MTPEEPGLRERDAGAAIAGDIVRGSELQLRQRAARADECSFHANLARRSH